MNGLLVKDLIILRWAAKRLVAMAIIFIVAGWVDKTSGMLVSVAFIFGMMTLSSFSYDQFSNWETFSLTAPISKIDYVMSKYLLSGILSLLGTGIVLVSLVAKLLVTDSFNSELVMVLVGTALFGSFMFSTLTLPLLFKYPIEKARIVIMSSVAAVFLIISGLGYLLKKANASVFDKFATITGGQLIIVLFATLLILAISFSLSHHFFKQKFN